MHSQLMTIEAWILLGRFKDDEQCCTGGSEFKDGLQDSKSCLFGVFLHRKGGPQFDVLEIPKIENSTPIDKIYKICKI